jgi:hypothetical protein
MIEDSEHQKYSSLERQKLDYVLSLDINQFPELRTKVNFIGRDMARRAVNVLREAFQRGDLNFADLRNVVDFGAGQGEPTFIFNEMCKLIGGKIAALEQKTDNIQQLKKLLPNLPVFENGLDYLAALDSEVSLITAANFGPDYQAELFRKLARVSGHALAADGKLLVYSDPRTIAAVRSELGSREGAVIIPDLHPRDTYKHIPETIIFSKELCTAIGA